VVQTRSGFVGDREVVEVLYDPKILKLADLRKGAESQDLSATLSAAHILRYDTQPKYYLQANELKYLPMTELQASRVNASLQSDWRVYLSPKQLVLLELIEAHPKIKWPVAIGQDFVPAWQVAAKLAAPYIVRD
jgi:hypothetical protein